MPWTKTLLHLSSNVELQICYIFQPKTFGPQAKYKYVHRDNLFAQFKNYLHIYISKIKMLLNTLFYFIFLHQIIRDRKSYICLCLYFHSWIWRSLVVHIFKEAHFYCMKPRLIQWIILPPLSSKELWVGKRKVI